MFMSVHGAWRLALKDLVPYSVKCINIDQTIIHVNVELRETNGHRQNNNLNNSFKKEAHGPHAHPGKHFISINTYDYIIMLINRG